MKFLSMILLAGLLSSCAIKVTRPMDCCCAKKCCAEMRMDKECDKESCSLED